MEKKNKVVIAVAMLLLIGMIGGYIIWKSNTGQLNKDMTSDENSVQLKISELNAKISSSLKIIDSLPDKHYKIDADIENAVNDKNNTFDKPLVIQDPYDIAPLTALAVFYTENNVGIRMTIEGDTKSDTFVYEFPKANGHRIPIIGLYPDRENTVVLEEIYNGQTTEKKELKIKTDPLPNSLQGMVEVTDSEREAVEGITIVSGQYSNIPYAFDSSGNIRWYIRVTTEGHGYFPMANGRFMLMNVDAMIPTLKRPYASQVYDMDFLGRVHNIYMIPNGTHHDIQEKTPNGNLLVLSNSLVNHVEDMVVEIDRKTGKVIKKLYLSDVIKDTYNTKLDWAHLNSISFNAKEDSVILSVRDVSSAVKLDWATGKIKWILSDPRIWKGTPYEKYVLKPDGPTMWHYEEHAAYQMPEDLDNNPKTIDIMMFDNRTLLNEPVKSNVTKGLGQSAVTQYAVDEKNGTVKQVRRFPNAYSYITSNYQLFYDKDRLIASHGSIYIDKNSWGEIYEYEYSTGKLVRSYKTKKTFYRAYRQQFDYKSCSTPMEITGSFVKGNQTPLSKEKYSADKPAINIPKKLNMWISDGFLYIKMPNLSISKVELVGQTEKWSANLISNPAMNITKKQMKKGALPTNNLLYSVAMPLKNLTKDKDSIDLVYYGIKVSTGNKLEIK